MTTSLRDQCDPLVGPVNSLTLLVSEKIPDTGECETEFRIRPRPDLGGDHFRRARRT
jgi:hypothetical protein